MPKQKSDYLIRLINSLEKAEKRHFRLFAGRNSTGEDSLFLKLFDLLDKTNNHQTEVILKKIPGIKRQQISNIKANLYTQILSSLRLFHRNKDLEIRLSEQVDYARLLYKKGLYKASLDILVKTKKSAKEAGRLNIALEALDLEKHIELQHVTGSMAPKAEELSESSARLIEAIDLNQKLSSLSLNIYGLFLKNGYVRNERDYNFHKKYFEQNLPKYDWNKLNFRGKIFLCQSQVWYSNMTQDFLNYYRYSARWVQVFDEHPEFKARGIPTYLKGIHNLLNSLFLTEKYEKHREALENLNNFAQNPPFKLSRNEESLAKLFYHTHIINSHFLSGDFTKSLERVPEILEAIESEKKVWDDFRVTRFHYKIATLYFASGDNETAIDYLNMVLNSEKNVRPDVEAFARFLDLIAHFELGNMMLVASRVKSLYRFLLKIENLDEVQAEILKFLRRMPRFTPDNWKIEFTNLRNKLVEIREKPYEKRAFFYLDFISWLESKIENRTVEEVVREKFLIAQRD